METETTQRMESAKPACLADRIHHLAQQRHVVDVLAFVQFVGELAAAFDDFAAEAFDFVGRHVAEFVVKRFAGFELLAVNQQSVAGGPADCRARRNCGTAASARSRGCVEPSSFCR